MRIAYILVFISILSCLAVALDFNAMLNPVSVDSGRNYTFTLTFNNTNSTNVTEVNITLPSPLTYIANTNTSTNPTTFEHTGSVLSWKGNFTSLSLENVTFNATIYSNQNVSGNLTVTATYASEVQRTNITVNVANYTPALNDIIVDLTPVNITSGANYSFSLVFNNTNPDNATEIVVSLPPFLTYINNTNASTNPTSFILSGSSLVWKGNFTNMTNETLRFNATAYSGQNTSGNIVVKASYPGQNKTTSVGINIVNYTYSSQSGSVSLTGPANGSTVRGNVVISCSATHASGVKSISLLLNRTDSANYSLGIVDTWNFTGGGTESISVNFNLPEGRHVWNCLSTGMNNVTALAAYDNMFFVDNIGPLLSFTSPTPADNSSINITYFETRFTSNEAIVGSLFSLSTTGSNSSIIFNDNFTVSGLAGAYIFNATKSNITNLSDGYYRYTISVNDSLNNSRSYSRGIYIDRTPPLISMSTAPSVGVGGSFKVDCAATDAISRSFNFTSKIAISGSFGNSVVIYNDSYRGSVYSINVSSNHTQTPGSYVLYCSAIDDAGNTRTSVQSYQVTAGGSGNGATNNQPRQNNTQPSPVVNDSSGAGRDFSGPSDSDRTRTQRSEENESSNGSLLYVVLFILIIGAVVGGTIWYLNKKGVFVVMSIPDRSSQK